jgi:taurine--2-oxoglutarate transaminase
MIRAMAQLETITSPYLSTAYANDRAHVFHSWSAQGALNPTVIAGARGSRMWDDKGNSWLDFSSQLVNVNIGHQHPKLVAAIQEQAARLCTIAPFHANDMRGECARPPRRAGTGRPRLRVLHQRRHRGGRERGAPRARPHRAPQGALDATAATTGHRHVDHADRRSAPLGQRAGRGRRGQVLGPYLYRSAFHATTPAEESERALEHLANVLMVEGPHTVAAIVLETVVGTNGILVPPDGYLAGVRALCDKHGIVMVCDEVMAGFGRCGEWFAVDRWKVTPDLISFAKGSNSGYLPIGGVLISKKIAETYRDRVYPGGLTYSGHPLACASVVASIGIFREEKIVENARMLGTDVIGPELTKIAAKHPSVGEVRGLGVFWAIELVRSRKTRKPLVPFNASGADAKPMVEVMNACKAGGVWPFAHFNRLQVTPPCTTTPDEAREGLAAIDKALDVADKYCE